MTWLLRAWLLKAAGLGSPLPRAPRPTAFSPMPVLPVTEQRLVLENGPHRKAEAAVEVVHPGVRIEVEVPRVVRVARVERTRPVVAERASVVELTVTTVARSGQEETVAVVSREELTVHAVLLRPSDGRVVVELLELFLGGHTPANAPIGCGSIIFWKQGGQAVGEAVVAVVGIGAVLGEGVLATVAVLVVAPVVGVLRRGFAPSEVVAVVLGAVGTHIAGGPQEAARQA